MANPTTIVSHFVVPYAEEHKYVPLPTLTAGNAGLFVPGEMIGRRLADGYADHFDDTEPMIFEGLYDGPTYRYDDRDAPPTPARVHMPRFFSMPLASGSATYADIGKTVYAATSGTVQFTPIGLTYANACGRVADITRGEPSTLTGATSVLIERLPPNRGDGGMVLTPAALSGAVNDYAPTGIELATVVLLSGGGAARNITGISAGRSGRRLTLVNLSTTATENLVLKHADASSVAANRFIGANAADVTVRAGGAVDLYYDGVASRWRPLAI